MHAGQTALVIAAVIPLLAWLRKAWVDRSDAEVVGIVTEGQAAAYEVLVERYQRRVYAVVRRMVHSHDETDDIVQEAFVRAYMALDTFDVERNFYTWLCRIAMNQALNLIDRKRRRATDSLDERTDGTGFEPAGHQDTSADLEKSELEDALQRALEQLPEGMCEVFVLRTFDELTYEEIADVLGIARGTVMSRLSRARERVQAALREFVEPPGG